MVCPRPSAGQRAISHVLYGEMRTASAATRVFPTGAEPSANARPRAIRLPGTATPIPPPVRLRCGQALFSGRCRRQRSARPHPLRNPVVLGSRRCTLNARLAYCTTRRPSLMCGGAGFGWEPWASLRMVAGAPRRVLRVPLTPPPPLSPLFAAFYWASLPPLSRLRLVHDGSRSPYLLGAQGSAVSIVLSPEAICFSWTLPLSAAAGPSRAPICGLDSSHFQAIPRSSNIMTGKGVPGDEMLLVLWLVSATAPKGPVKKKNVSCDPGVACTVAAGRTSGVPSGP